MWNRSTAACLVLVLACRPAANSHARDESPAPGDVTKEVAAPPPPIADSPTGSTLPPAVNDPRMPTPLPPCDSPSRIQENGQEIALGFCVPHYRPKVGSPRPVDVILTAKEVAGVGFSGPVSGVVPLPYGAVQSLASLGVFDESGTQVPAQLEVVNRHVARDNSVRHVKVTVLAQLDAFNPSAAGSGTSRFRLTSASSPVSTQDSVVVSRIAHGYRMSTAGFSLDVASTGPLLSVPSGPLVATLVDASGSHDLFARDDLAISLERAGPLVATILVTAPTRYQSGGMHRLGFAARVSLVAGKRQVRIELQLRNGALESVFARPYYFHSLTLGVPSPVQSAARIVSDLTTRTQVSAPALATQSVAAAIRHFHERGPHAMSTSVADSKLLVELFPADGRQRQDGAEVGHSGYWLDDMQATLKEVVLDFSGIDASAANALAASTRWPPLLSVPSSWYAATAVSLDLDGLLPVPEPTARTDKRTPDYTTYGGWVKDSHHLGWLDFALDANRRWATSSAGDWPYGVGRYFVSEDPADYYAAQDAAMAELNVRPVWLAGYSYARDHARLLLTENPYSGDYGRDSGRNYRRFVAACFPKLDAPGLQASLAAYANDQYCSLPVTGFAYEEGSRMNASARDDEHGWTYHVAEAWAMSGDPWMRDWFEFIGEFRKTRLNQQDPFPNMNGRAVGHALAQAVQAYVVTGDVGLLAGVSQYVARYFRFQDSLDPVSGGRASYIGGAGTPTDIEAPFQLGFLARALVNYLVEAGTDDRPVMAALAGFANWNLHYARYGWYQGPRAQATSSDGSAQTLVDPVLWLHAQGGDAALAEQARAFVDEGFGVPPPATSNRPYANMRQWRGDFCGRVSSALLPAR